MIGDNMSAANLKNIYFQRSNGEFVLIEESVTQEDARLVMKHFLDERNYKSYYTRSWEHDGARWYDVGSWSEFFVWANEEDIERLKMNEQEIAKYRKKKNNSSRSEKKADHKHEYHDCLVVYKYNWSNKDYIHRQQYCVVCGKINTHYSWSIAEMFQDIAYDEKGIMLDKYSDLPVFHLNNHNNDYVNLQEAQSN